mmetsp:Transcript_159/g.130  ORF Transcript_159/g.130 Transcript_159/m.130 type:complete len:80 (+) Transcript_159:64-303(+)
MVEWLTSKVQDMQRLRERMDPKRSKVGLNPRSAGSIDGVVKTLVLVPVAGLFGLISNGEVQFPPKRGVREHSSDLNKDA